MKTLKNKKYKHGGDAIDSGSYGCVFRPSLKCKNKTRKKGVSKLMLKKDADEEVELIKPIYDLTKRYPLIKKHILIPDINSVCVPDKISKKDLKTFNDICYRLNYKGYKASTINTQLDDFRVLHMDDGGITVKSYISSLKPKQEYNIIKSLMNIYKFVIIPMNNNGYFHSDIKDNNILVKQHKLKVIDFGLLIRHDNTSIHPRFLNHSLHHLTPYSVLLFNDNIDFDWELFYSKYKHLQKLSFLDHCAEYIKEKFKMFKDKKTESDRELYGQSNIKSLCHTLFPNNEPLDVICHQIAYSYYYYKDPITGRFNILEFYNNVFIYLIDVWGLCSILVVLLNKLIKQKRHHKYIDHLKHLIKKYMFGMEQYPFPSDNEFYNDLESFYQTRKSQKKTKKNNKKVY